MKQYVFSVIIATHYRAALLRRAIESVKAQTCSRCQTIVVSDVSDADTYSVSQELLEDQDLFIQRHGASGPAESRNLALKVATGDYVVFLDDDDAFRPDYFEQAALHILVMQPNSIVYANFEVIDPVATPTITRVDLSAFHKEQVWTKNFIPNNCAIYPRAVLQNVSYDPRIAYEDWDFLLAAHSQSDLQHIPIFGPIIHKNTSTVQAHRGDVNENSELLNCYIHIYSRFPPRSPLVAQQRQALMHSIGLDISQIVNNDVVHTKT
jgi:GalNAc5-diNAcBac-PP-undecaprenol beta-1,3-glucosyltransferase